jgi:fibronectin type 3 domain-containing protein
MDQDYVYTLRAVRKVEETSIESEGCAEVSISTTDSIPPDVPTGLVAIPTSTGIVLKWNAREDADLRGYNLYRQAGGTADFVKVTPVPLTIASYLDTSVEKGQTYTYAVTALDDARETNESNRSTAVTIHYNQ